LELEAKLVALNAKVAYLTDVNENIELKTMVEIQVKFYQQIKDGKTKD